MDEPNKCKIKVTHYFFAPDEGKGILVYYSSSPQTETVYCFKFERGVNHYPNYPDKEVRIVNKRKIISRVRYQAITDDSTTQIEHYLNSEDTVVLFKVLPLMKNNFFLSICCRDTLIVPNIKGYRKLDNQRQNVGCETKSAFYK